MPYMANQNGVAGHSIEHKIVADGHHSPARRVSIGRKALGEVGERIARAEHSLDQPTCNLRLAAILRDTFIDRIESRSA